MVEEQKTNEKNADLPSDEEYTEYLDFVKHCHDEITIVINNVVRGCPKPKCEHCKFLKYATKFLSEHLKVERDVVSEDIQEKKSKEQPTNTHSAAA